MTTQTPVLEPLAQMALKDWRALNSVLSALSEQQLEAMLAVERTTRKRLDIAIRIHQRYGQIRTARERSEVMTDCEKGGVK